MPVPQPVVLLKHFVHAPQTIINAIGRHLAQRRIERVLNALPDHILNDVGIERQAIHSIAKRGASSVSPAAVAQTQQINPLDDVNVQLQPPSAA